MKIGVLQVVAAWSDARRHAGMDERFGPMAARDELAERMAGWVLDGLAADPHGAEAECELDLVADDEVRAMTGFDVGELADLFGRIGDRLGAWSGEPAVRFMIRHGVPAEDARAVAAAAEAVATRAGARGASLAAREAERGAEAVLA